MIEKIQICNVASYGAIAEELADLQKINFIYGSNGTGKTTVSRVVADCQSHSQCKLIWKDGSQMERLVYNRDFVDRNFNQSSDFKGIFTLGENDDQVLGKIQSAKAELDQIKGNIVRFNNVLDGNGELTGKRAQLATLESEFENRCWDIKSKYDARFEDAFAGARAKKKDFKNRLLAESKSNTSSSVPLVELEKKAQTVFGEAPVTADLLILPDEGGILAHESDDILAKKVIGKEDVDIAALIQKLGSSDWVKQGRKFYDPDQRVCPFCQQDTPATLESDLNQYFDEIFIADTKKIKELHEAYKIKSDHLLQRIKEQLDDPSEFLNADKLKAEHARLESKIGINLQRLGEKIRESSKPIALESLKDILEVILVLMNNANASIKKHNKMVADIGTEREVLKGQVWRNLLDNEIQTDLATYNGKKAGLDGAIEKLEKKIKESSEEQRKKELEIQTLEKDNTSIQPTINGINELLRSFGFTGFVLAKSDRDRFYQIQRPDGSNAKETLSEGEKSFITFLYFYHLLKGSENESGMTSDRVVVFDDPVSSLDSDVLFIVSNLIKGLFDEVRGEAGTIRQVFVLTHNVYFHKEVSFNPRRCADTRLRDETFWTVRKTSQQSKIKSHDTNPVKTSYELLWIEIREPERDSLAIQNTMRRILENYFKILGNVDPDDICGYFEGNEKLICRSLFSWANDGSHFAHDSLFVSIDDSMVEIYSNVFKRIFEKTDHIAHYNMMMGDSLSGEQIEPTELAS